MDQSHLLSVSKEGWTLHYVFTQSVNTLTSSSWRTGQFAGNTAQMTTDLLSYLPVVKEWEEKATQRTYSRRMIKSRATSGWSHQLFLLSWGNRSQSFSISGKYWRPSHLWPCHQLSPVQAGWGHSSFHSKCLSTHLMLQSTSYILWIPSGGLEEPCRDRCMLLQTQRAKKNYQENTWDFKGEKNPASRFQFSTY